MPGASSEVRLARRAKAGPPNEMKTYSDRIRLVGLRTKNSVDPAPAPFSRLRAIAAFPFSMQGVIFAKSTSFSANMGKPFETCPKGRTSDDTMRPVCSQTAAIGTKLTGRSAEARSVPTRGLIWTTSPKLATGQLLKPPAPQVQPPAPRYRRGSRPFRRAIPPAIRVGRGAPPPRGFPAGSGRRRG